jgi:hypothetical protein
MNLSIDVIALVIGAVLAIVWLVRLEGRVNGKADSTSVVVTNEKVAALEASAKVHESTKEEVIRLQEQIKHLTGLIQGWLSEQASQRQTERAQRSVRRRQDAGA